MVESSSSVALISVKPKYAEAILSGHKRCEFRRTRFARDVDYVVLYATLPVGRVVGVARVSKITQASTDELWESFSPEGGVSEDEFTAYFAGKECGVAISLDSVVCFDEDVELLRLGEITRPPQSFQYLDGEAISNLMEYAAQ